ncbi:hypothetical protein NQT62_11350 [Limnobacter humi]|uniref:Uncharacterized protein n=2 Tax=Limnobacter humi TaxID=1778671 RepID=A0ABT1WHZ0_9BURK|nr:hypothetical protein [Limnobacter humi]
MAGFLGLGLLGGCAIVDFQNAIVPGFRSVLKGDNGKEALASLNQEQRDTLLYFTYGNDYLYLSPAQRDSMFADSRSFLWNIAARFDVYLSVYMDNLLAGKKVDIPDGKGGTISLKAEPSMMEELQARKLEIDQAIKAWPTVRQLNLGLNKAAVDERLALIKQRVGSSAFDTLKSGRARTLTSLVYDDAALAKFLTDDQTAVQAVQTAYSEYGYDNEVRGYDFDNTPTAILTFDQLLKQLQPVTAFPSTRIGS